MAGGTPLFFQIPGGMVHPLMFSWSVPQRTTHRSLDRVIICDPIRGSAGTEKRSEMETATQPIRALLPPRFLRVGAYCKIFRSSSAGMIYELPSFVAFSTPVLM